MVGRTPNKRSSSALDGGKQPLKACSQAHTNTAANDFLSEPSAAIALPKEVVSAARTSSASAELAQVDALIGRYLRTAQHKSAMFWADKRLALCRNAGAAPSVLDMAEFVKVLAATGDHTRLIAYSERHELVTKHVLFAYYYVNSLFKMKLYLDILKLKIANLCGLNEASSSSSPSVSNFLKTECCPLNKDEAKALDKVADELKLEASLWLIVGKTYLLTQNRKAAQVCLQSAALKDPCAVEAVQLIQKFNLVSKSPLEDLMQRALSVDSDVPDVLRHYYHLIGQMDEKKCAGGVEKDTEWDALSCDLSIRTARAASLYLHGDVLAANRITSEILEEAGMFQDCILVHVATLVQLHKSEELFMLGHKLVDCQPDNELSWYTVGCYYYTIGQFGAAKNFLNKCTTMNSSFGEGWLAFGHVLSAESEHEQAMNCYLRASRVLEGNFEPLMYIGLEYSYANNTKLAQDFLKDSAEIAGENALILHEQGCIYYMKKDWPNADEYFTKALRLAYRESDASVDVCTLLCRPLSDFWEPLVNNLGHVNRKRGNFNDAIKFHQKSLSMCPRKASTIGAMAVALACAAQVDRAVHYFHEALSILPHDQFLKQALEKLFECLKANTSLRPFDIGLSLDNDVQNSSRLELTKADLEGNEEEKECQRKALEMVKRKAKKIPCRTPVVSRSRPEVYHSRARASGATRTTVPTTAEISEVSESADVDMAMS